MLAVAAIFTYCCLLHYHVTSSIVHSHVISSTGAQSRDYLSLGFPVGQLGPVAESGLVAAEESPGKAQERLSNNIPLSSGAGPSTEPMVMQQGTSGSNPAGPNEPTGNAPQMGAGPASAVGSNGSVVPTGDTLQCPGCSESDIFKKYLQQHNKQYANQYEEEVHKNILADALKRIKELNELVRRAGDALFGRTKFSDLSFGDFVKKFTGGMKELAPAEKFEEDLGPFTAALPLTYDWRDEGVVPAVRDQKECGACYAFSTSDLTAAQWAIDHAENGSQILAPQFAVDCVKDSAAFGCDGGRPYLVLESNANCTGDSCAWPKESCYPYVNQLGTCRIPGLQCQRDEKPQIKVRQAYYLDVSSGGGKAERERLGVLLQGGPVVALVSVTDHWQHYLGGVMRGEQCKDVATEPNHAVLIVGYNFTDPNSSYYIIKNTWDKDWGENGYFRMEAGANACGIGQFLSFACTEDCGDGRSAKSLLDRARKRLQKRGLIAATNATTGEQPYQANTTIAEQPYQQQTTTPPAVYPLAPGNKTAPAYTAVPALWELAVRRKLL